MQNLTVWNVCYWPNELMTLYACIKEIINLSIKVKLIIPLSG